MFRAPTWITSATSSTCSRSRVSISSVTIGSPVSSLASSQQPQALVAESLEAVRRRARLVGAAAQHRAAALLHRLRGRQQLLAALDRARPGHQGEVAAADSSPVHLHHRRHAVAELAGGKLVRLRDRHDPVHAVGAFEVEVRDPLAIPDRADHGQHLALGDVGMSADRFHALDHGSDLLRRGLLFHDDHHRRVPSPKLLGFLPGFRVSCCDWRGPHREGCFYRYGARPRECGCAGAQAGRAPS